MVAGCQRLVIATKNIRSATTKSIHHASENTVTLSALNGDGVPAEPTDCTSGNETVGSATDVDSVAASFL
jgi:hypothetical protein